MKKTNNYTLTEGPIFKSLLLYSIPIIITNVVQLIFHITDVAVLAIMADDYAVASVGACGSIITLLVNLFTGFATGSNVLIAKRIGEKNMDGVKKGVGASFVIGLASGLILMTAGLIFAREFLIITNCQNDVLDGAVTYLVIYFCGMPIIMLYTFIASVFGAMGDSVRPMRYMLISGVINLVLNMIFTGLLKLSVAGVALATVISNLIALILALIALFKNKEYCDIKANDIKLKKEEFSEIVKVGIPTCFCSIFFYMANVIISSVINSISTDAMTASAVASQFDGIIYNVGFSIAIAASVMVGQNYGAKSHERIKKTMRMSVLYATSVSLILGTVFVFLANSMIGIMTDNPDVTKLAKDRMVILCLTYFVTSIMEVFSFSLRAMGKATITMIVGAICGLLMRGGWAWFVWPLYPTFPMIFQCYPVTAFIAIIIYLFYYKNTMRELNKEWKEEL